MRKSLQTRAERRGFLDGLRCLSSRLNIFLNFKEYLSSCLKCNRSVKFTPFDVGDGVNLDTKKLVRENVSIIDYWGNQ